MHFHFPFSVLEILWTLTFAAHLVLLVVLMGRDRIARFPWFTASITLVAFRLLTSRILFGKLPQMAMSTVFIVMADLGAIIGLLVILELARRAFGGVSRATWVGWALPILVVGAVVLIYWGPWPAWKTLSSGSTLPLLQFLAQKASLLVDVENIVVGLLIVVFGGDFKAGWHSHTQRIAIGLSTASISQLGIQIVWQLIARKAAPQNMTDYQHILDLRDRLFNTNSAIYVAVLIWWIVCLWFDEPGTSTNAAIPVNETVDANLPPREAEPAQQGTDRPSPDQP